MREQVRIVEDLPHDREHTTRLKKVPYMP
jgi:hypothetical protein